VVDPDAHPVTVTQFPNGDAMYLSLYLVGAMVFVAIAYAIGLALYRRYHRYDGEMALTCPENHEPVSVALDAGLALTGELRGTRDLKLRACTRWPEREGCDEACLDQIVADPHELLTRVKIAEWFEGKDCAVCGRELRRVEEQERQPAFLAPDGEFVESDAVDPHDLDRVFATHLPVCWHCHFAVTFRRKHPELVVDPA
jgi:hypothetical protein